MSGNPILEQTTTLPPSTTPHLVPRVSEVRLQTQKIIPPPVIQSSDSKPPSSEVLPSWKQQLQQKSTGPGNASSPVLSGNSAGSPVKSSTMGPGTVPGITGLKTTNLTLLPGTIVYNSQDRPTPLSPTSKVKPNLARAQNLDSKWKRLTVKTYDMRSRVLLEIFSTEKSYVQDLRLLKRLYLDPMKADSSLASAEDINVIFLNIEVILAVNEQLCAQLEAVIPNENCIDGETQVGSAFLKIMDFLKMYSFYCSKYKNGIAHSSKCEEKNPAYAKFLKETSENPECKGLFLHDLLIKPVQRLCKYPLLFRELQKFTPQEHPDYAGVQTAMKKVEEAAEVANKISEGAENLQKLVTFNETVTGCEDLQLDHFSSQRKALLDEWLLVCRSNNLSEKTPANARHAYLFNDLIILTKLHGGKGEKKSEKFRDAMLLRHCILENVPDSKKRKNVILFIVSPNDSTRYYQMIFRTPGAKTQWLKVEELISKEKSSSNSINMSSSNSDQPSTLPSNILSTNPNTNTNPTHTNLTHSNPTHTNPTHTNPAPTPPSSNTTQSPSVQTSESNSKGRKSKYISNIKKNVINIISTKNKEEGKSENEETEEKKEKEKEKDKTPKKTRDMRRENSIGSGARLNGIINMKDRDTSNGNVLHQSGVHSTPSQASSAIINGILNQPSIFHTSPGSSPLNGSSTQTSNPASSSLTQSGYVSTGTSVTPPATTAVSRRPLSSGPNSAIISKSSPPSSPRSAELAAQSPPTLPHSTSNNSLSDATPTSVPQSTSNNSLPTTTPPPLPQSTSNNSLPIPTAAPPVLPPPALPHNTSNSSLSLNSLPPTSAPPLSPTSATSPSPSPVFVSKTSHLRLPPPIIEHRSPSPHFPSKNSIPAPPVLPPPPLPRSAVTSPLTRQPPPPLPPFVPRDRERPKSIFIDNVEIDLRTVIGLETIVFEQPDDKDHDSDSEDDEDD